MHNHHFLSEKHVKLSQKIMILTFGSTMGPAVVLGWNSAVPLDLQGIAGMHTELQPGHLQCWGCFVVLFARTILCNSFIFLKKICFSENIRLL